MSLHLDRCLSESTAVELVEGRLGAAQREAMQQHLDACAACRQLVSALAAAEFPGRTAPVVSIGSLETEPALLAPVSLLAPGTTLGRYVILEPLGAGGMGVVYAAYDPRLERKVALKRVRMSGLVGEARTHALGERLVREAQAMARLSHPNVTVVHDASAEDDELFIAMELVDGRTLSRWLDEEVRSWREVVEVFVLAGRGLEAAHIAGLAHRDFKPDNVLVSHTGRVSVSDFGLARHLTAEPGSTSPAAGSDANATVGALGTPAYMAPEQRRNAHDADARSDQYSYCAALHEALWGVRPAGLPAARIARTPARGRIPAAVRRVLERGLQHEPADRYPTMTELLAALERASRPNRGPVLVAGSSALVLLVAALWLHTAPGEPPCGDAGRHLAGAWGFWQRLALHGKLASRSEPYAAATWQTVERELDGHASRWSAMYREACEATAVHHAQPEPVLALRMTCLDQRRQELEQAVLQLADPAMPLDHAVQVASSVPNVARCADLTALAEPVPPPADLITTAQVADVRRRLARAKAQCDAGLYAACAASARSMVAEARHIGYAPLVAQTSYRLGLAEIRANHTAAAEHALDEAILAGEAGREDEVVANATAIQVIVVGYLAGRYDEGARLVARAEAATARLATVSPQLARDATGSLIAARSSLALGHNDLALAVTLGEQAIPYSEQTYGPESPQTARLHINLAASLQSVGRYDDAISQYERARTIITATEGDTHPDTIVLDRNVATLMLQLNKYPEAAQRLERARATAEASLGPTDRQYVQVLETLSALQIDQDHPREALASIDRALAARATWPSSAPAEHLVAMTQRAGVLQALGRRDEAAAQLRDAISLGEQQLGASNPGLVDPLRRLAITACDAKRTTEALGLFERAAAIATSANGSAPAAARVRLLEAECLGSVGQVARAVAMARAVRATMAATTGGERLVKGAEKLLATYAHPEAAARLGRRTSGGR